MEIERDGQNKESFTKKVRKNPWVLATLVLGILSVVLVFGNFAGNLTGNVVSKKVVEENLVGYLNTVADSEISLLDIIDEGNMYLATIKFQGEEIPVYVTKDGEYYTTNLISLDENVNLGPSVVDSQPRQTTPPDSDSVDVSEDDDAVLGDKDAPITIIEFSDYECPFCARFYLNTLPQLKREYIDTGKVKLIYRDFPLGFHQNAQKAAEATEIAEELGGGEKFWEMHDKIFENQQAITIEDLVRYAEEIGLNKEKFKELLDTNKYENEVLEDFQDGQKAGVQGTPTFFINGQVLVGAQPFEAFQEIIEQELSK